MKVEKRLTGWLAPFYHVFVRIYIPTLFADKLPVINDLNHHIRCEIL